MLLARLCECCRQAQAEVASSSRKKIHQIWPKPFSRDLYTTCSFPVPTSRTNVFVPSEIGGSTGVSGVWSVMVSPEVAEATRINPMAADINLGGRLRLLMLIRIDI